MRPLWAAAVIAALLLETFPASATIRITAARYENGQLIIEGQASPNAKVTLDGKYHTTADGGGRFKFRESYKPVTCMSDITLETTPIRQSLRIAYWTMLPQR